MKFVLELSPFWYQGHLHFCWNADYFFCWHSNWKSNSAFLERALNQLWVDSFCIHFKYDLEELLFSLLECTSFHPKITRWRQAICFWDGYWRGCLPPFISFITSGSRRYKGIKYFSISDIHNICCHDMIWNSAVWMAIALSEALGTFSSMK